MFSFINSSSIPAWVVGINLILAGSVWLLTRRHNIRFDSRIMGFTLLAEGFMYVVVFQVFNPSIETRGFLSRLMVVILCFSNYLPLSISYIRHKKNDKQ